MGDFGVRMRWCGLAGSVQFGLVAVADQSRAESQPHTQQNRTGQARQLIVHEYVSILRPRVCVPLRAVLCVLYVCVCCQFGRVDWEKRATHHSTPTNTQREHINMGNYIHIYTLYSFF